MGSRLIFLPYYLQFTRKNAKFVAINLNNCLTKPKDYGIQNY